MAIRGARQNKEENSFSYTFALVVFLPNFNVDQEETKTMHQVSNLKERSLSQQQQRLLSIHLGRSVINLFSFSGSQFNDFDK